MSQLVSGEWVVDQNPSSGLLFLPLGEPESALWGEGFLSPPRLALQWM